METNDKVCGPAGKSPWVKCGAPLPPPRCCRDKKTNKLFFPFQTRKKTKKRYNGPTKAPSAPPFFLDPRPGPPFCLVWGPLGNAPPSPPFAGVLNFFCPEPVGPPAPSENPLNIAPLASFAPNMCVSSAIPQIMVLRVKRAPLFVVRPTVFPQPRLPPPPPVPSDHFSFFNPKGPAPPYSQKRSASETFPPASAPPPTPPSPPLWLAPPPPPHPFSPNALFISPPPPLNKRKRAAKPRTFDPPPPPTFCGPPLVAARNPPLLATPAPRTPPPPWKQSFCLRGNHDKKTKTAPPTPFFFPSFRPLPPPYFFPPPTPPP